jgi:hypothetical protein
MIVPKWMGEYMFEEEQRMAYVYLCYRKVAYIIGFGFTVWTISHDVWGKCAI